MWRLVAQWELDYSLLDLCNLTQYQTFSPAASLNFLFILCRTQSWQTKPPKILYEDRWPAVTKQTCMYRFQPQTPICPFIKTGFLSSKHSSFRNLPKSITTEWVFDPVNVIFQLTQTVFMRIQLRRNNSQQAKKQTFLIRDSQVWSKRRELRWDWMNRKQHLIKQSHESNAYLTEKQSL